MSNTAHNTACDPAVTGAVRAVPQDAVERACIKRGKHIRVQKIFNGWRCPAYGHQGAVIEQVIGEPPMSELGARKLEMLTISPVQAI